MKMTGKFKGLTPGQALRRYKREFYNQSSLKAHGWPDKWVKKLGKPFHTRGNMYGGTSHFWHESTVKAVEKRKDFKLNKEKKDIRGRKLQAAFEKTAAKNYAAVNTWNIVVPDVDLDEIYKKELRRLKASGYSKAEQKLKNEYVFDEVFDKTNYSELLKLTKRKGGAFRMIILLGTRVDNAIKKKYPRIANKQLWFVPKHDPFDL
jgi:hypothetical protein